MKAVELATMEEQDQDHIQKARARLDVGIQDITESSYKIKTKDSLEAEFKEKYPTILVSQTYSNRPSIGNDDTSRYAFIFDLDTRYVKYAYSKGNMPYLWVCCWAIDSNRFHDDTSTVGVLKNINLPARYPVKYVFGDHKLNREIRLKMLDKAIAMQREILRIHEMDVTRANHYPTLYLSQCNQSKSDLTAKRKPHTRFRKRETTSAENFHFCTAGSVTQPSAITYVTLEDYQKKYRHISYDQARDYFLESMAIKSEDKHRCRHR